MRRWLLIAAVASTGCAVEDPTGSPLRRGSASDDEPQAKEEQVLAAQGGETLGGSVTPTSAPPAACAGNDIALCFAFDGTTADQSATRVQPSSAAGIAFVAGKDATGGSFGPSSALQFGPNAAFDLPAGAATIEAWINRTETRADAVVLDLDMRFSLTIDAAGHVLCKSSGGAIVGVTVVPAGKWVHVACVIDRGTMRAYLDGAAEAVGPGAIIPSPTAGASIGGNAPSGEAFSGVIDVLRVFKVARTPEQIAAAAK